MLCFNRFLFGFSRFITSYDRFFTFDLFLGLRFNRFFAFLYGSVAFCLCDFFRRQCTIGFCANPEEGSGDDKHHGRQHADKNAFRSAETLLAGVAFCLGGTNFFDQFLVGGVF